MKLRVGLVGLGNAWESRHRQALRALSDRFEVRAICDQVWLRAEQAAREFGAQAMDGYRVLARRPDIDAVLLLAPQWYGSLPVLAACDESKAVYCTTGMGFDLSQARQIKERVEKAGIAFMTEFPRRQSPATIRLKELIATRLGAPRLLFCHTRVAVECPPGNVARSSFDSSSTNDLTELVDWCSYVVGHAPTSVFGLRHRGVTEGIDDDYQMMSLDFSLPALGTNGAAASVPPEAIESTLGLSALTGSTVGPNPVPSIALGTGAVAQISCGRYMPGAWQEAVAFRPPAALQVACERGIAFVDLPSTLVWFDQAGRHQESLENDRPVGEQMLCQFHRAVTSLVHNPSGLEDAYRALSIVLKARASHTEARRVFL
jgi:predicted dehydrogenase